jgi:hypothetical protein
LRRKNENEEEEVGRKKRKESPLPVKPVFATVTGSAVVWR